MLQAKKGTPVSRDGGRVRLQKQEYKESTVMSRNSPAALGRIKHEQWEALDSLL